MKKCLLTVLTILSCGALQALPVGNPAEPSLFQNGLFWGNYSSDPCDSCLSWFEAWSIRTGFYGDYVYNRHLAVDNHNHKDSSSIEDTEIYTNSWYLALNFCERVDVFGTLGASSLFIRTDATSWNSPLSRMSELRFDTDLSWSAGARAILWGCGCLKFGLEGQYFQINTHTDSFLNYNTGSLTYFSGGNSAHYNEWQVGLGASYFIATHCPTVAMMPYAAVKWARAKLKLDELSFLTENLQLTLEDLKNNKCWGFAIGVSLTLCEISGVTVEGRWGDEKALYVNGQLRF